MGTGQPEGRVWDGPMRCDGRSGVPARRFPELTPTRCSSIRFRKASAGRTVVCPEVCFLAQGASVYFY